MTNGGVQGPIEGYNSLDDLLTTTPTPGQAALLLPTAPTAAYTHPKWMEPYFDPSTPRNVTALMGKSAYLSCRVRNLANKTVSFDLKMHWSKSVQLYFEVLIKDQNTLLILRSKLFKIYKLYFFCEINFVFKMKSQIGTIFAIPNYFFKCAPESDWFRCGSFGANSELVSKSLLSCVTTTSLRGH